MNLGAALARLGRLDRRPKAAQRASSSRPTMPMFTTCSPTSNPTGAMGRGDGGVPRVLALDPAYLDAYEGLVYLLCRAGNTEEAVSCPQAGGGSIR